VASLAAATFLTALATLQQYTSARFEDLPADWVSTLRREALNWYAWAVVAPLVVGVGPRIARLPRGRMIQAWGGAALLFTLLHALLEVSGARALGVAGQGMAFGTMLWARYLATLAPNLLVFSLIALAFYLVAHQRETRDRELRESQLKAALAEAEIAVLRMRLQPHFLFNTLHTASALMQDDVEGARRVLTRLSDLLRLSLDQADVNEVPLSDELAFLEAYLEIQRTRFRDRLKVRLVVADDIANALVPSLLMQPLVENAIRHAIEPREAGGTVEVRVERRGDDLEIEILDDGPGLPTDGVARSGMGISNTRARLAALYGDEHRFELANRPQGGVRARIRVPFHRDSEPARR
jgi:LytS/YehU family sensor histidine kinase